LKKVLPPAAALPCNPVNKPASGSAFSQAQSDAVNEAAALREGEYVAVRRFTRLLEGGAEAKAALDQVHLRCNHAWR
jgi:hypothetical protein